MDDNIVTILSANYFCAVEPFVYIDAYAVLNAQYIDGFGVSLLRSIQNDNNSSYFDGNTIRKRMGFEMIVAANEIAL